MKGRRKLCRYACSVASLRLVKWTMNCAAGMDEWGFWGICRETVDSDDWIDRQTTEGQKEVEADGREERVQSSAVRYRVRE